MVMMRITNGNKDIVIPSLAIVLGALVVDNIVANVCKTKIINNQEKQSSKKDN